MIRLDMAVWLKFLRESSQKSGNLTQCRKYKNKIPNIFHLIKSIEYKKLWTLPSNNMYYEIPAVFRVKKNRKWSER